ncbi:(deoxy)nucleoside triphosphate pyrophosphohydrolase [Desulfovibrio psychrotolerans]|uniref:8-oxo-dGTP diphosphatase n=1 Tax=Desulfovibrio psychrotolerans TaxID=415242 RepID=A0A7J0BVT8_9BACT|nr:(deoxy)nucleoside triphosphate pyrophosphohydrolase [Desulfovibrio psychrotolerans]GFM37803.1 DNA mismatch repair protein MutT [Desulfovibrio psychrotolerans]
MKEIHVVAGIVWRNGRFLAARRPEGKAHAGFWEFPGGKMEPGETREQALVREFREEMSITPLVWEFWRTVRHAYPEQVVHLYFYHITSFAGSVHPAEGHETGWFSHEQALELPFLEADIAVVRELRNAPYFGHTAQEQS